MRNRNYRIVVCLTENELDALTQKVNLSGLNRETFIRYLLNGCTIKEAPPNELPEFIRLLRRLNANADQILRQMNAGGIIDIPAVNKMTDEIYGLEQKIRMIYFTGRED